MICMRPIAPFDDLARTSPALSTLKTERIHCTGTPKRREASSMKSAKGSLVRELAVCAADRASAAAEKSHTVSTKINGTTTRTLLTNERKHAIVLAPVQGKAASRRPFGRPGPPLRATAARLLVGTEEWCRTRSNRGMADRIPNTRTISPPRSTQGSLGQSRPMSARTRNSDHPASWRTASS
jgi:hypothetical protein